MSYFSAVSAFIQIICSTITAIKHYLSTALCMWMLLEGINLYMKVVKVFTIGIERQYLAYILVGWGIPAVIVGLVAAINPFTYDMSVLLQEDIQCGSLQFTLTFDRDRSVIYTLNFIDNAGLIFGATFKISPCWGTRNGVWEGETPLGISIQ